MEREEDTRSKQFARPDQDVKVRPRGCLGEESWNTRWVVGISAGRGLPES